MSTMRQILREVETTSARTPVGEAVNAAVVDRMAQAMLDSPKLAPIAGRVLDDEQWEMFSGLMLEPLRALIAKALDVSGVAVSGGLLSKAGREMKSAARGDIGVSEGLKDAGILDAIKADWANILAQLVADKNNEEYYQPGVNPDEYGKRTSEKMMSKMIANPRDARGALSRNSALKKAAARNGIKTSAQWDSLFA
jgi:hypothetical protein